MTIAVTRFCPGCGNPCQPHDAYCTTCGKATSSPAPISRFWAAPIRVDAPWRSSTSPWLVFGLMVTTFGFYEFYWLFDTWRQLRAEDGDKRKAPVWHALSVFVPIYGLYRLHAHMRAIRGLAGEAGIQVAWSVGVVLAGWIVLNVLENVPGIPVLIKFGLIVAEAALFAMVQSTLTRSWKRLPRGAAPRRVHPIEWGVVVLGGIITARVLLA